MIGEAMVGPGRVGARDVATWLNFEHALYLCLAAVALSIRLVGLGSVPLGPDEAAQALPALEAARGLPVDVVGLSPLLHTFQRPLFAAIGASDAAARWWPALLGGLSPLLFYFLRPRLTREGALVTAALWSISPLGVWSARLAIGDALVPSLALAVLAGFGGLWSRRSEGQQELPGTGPVVSTAVAVGLLMSAGPNTWAVLLAGLLALAWRPGLVGWLRGAVVRHARAALIPFSLALILGATFFGLEFAGLASVTGLVSEWLGEMLSGSGEYSSWELLRRLLLSEPLLLAAGIAGAVCSARRRDRFGMWAASATLLWLGLALLGRGRHPIDLGLVALGMALLAGPVIARGLRLAWSWRGQLDAWLLVAVSLVLIASASVSLPGAANPANSAAWRQLYLGIGLAAVVITALIWVVYGVWGTWQTVARALPLIPLVVGLYWGAGQTVSLSFDRGAWKRPAVLHTEPASGVRDLRATLQQLSALQGGAGYEAPVDLIWPGRPDDPMRASLRWLLRDFAGLRVGAALQDPPAQLVLTPVEQQPALSEKYMGMELSILQHWKPTALGDLTSHVRWLLYHESHIPASESKVILWADMTNGAR